MYGAFIQQGETMIHYAKLDNSPRLQALLAYLSDGKPHSVFSIQRETGSMCPHTDVDELRHNGLDIQQAYNGETINGRKRSTYQLILESTQLELAI